MNLLVDGKTLEVQHRTSFSAVQQINKTRSGKRLVNLALKLLRGLRSSRKIKVGTEYKEISSKVRKHNKNFLILTRNGAPAASSLTLLLKIEGKQNIQRAYM